MLTITLRQETETRLKDAASRRGVDAAEFAAEIIDRELSKPDLLDPTIDLMRKWMQEDATDDPEELANRQQEGEEFMRSLARTRIEMEGPNARKLWP